MLLHHLQHCLKNWVPLMRLLPILLWVVTCATALLCPSLQYPRLLPGVLDRDDVAHVSRLFFELEV